MLWILREIGRGMLPLGRIYEGHVNALRLILSFGTPAQIERCCEDARQGHLFGIWNTGTSAEDVEISKTGRLQGAKVFCSGSDLVTRPIVSANSQLLVLPLDELAVEIDAAAWQPLGMAASVSHRIDFTGVAVTPDMQLGPPDAYACQPWLSAGAIRFAAVQLGGAEALLDIVRGHLRDTGRTGHPYQEERVAKMSMDIEGGRLWLEGAARQTTLADRAPERLIHYIGMARTAIEGICFRTLQRSQQCVGLQGMLRPHPLERAIRDLTTYLRQPNPDGSFIGAGRHALSETESCSTLWQVEHFPPS